ncbi:hypothetical protein ACFX13_024672 [Malus domestica]
MFDNLKALNLSKPHFPSIPQSLPPRSPAMAAFPSRSTMTCSLSASVSVATVPQAVEKGLKTAIVRRLERDPKKAGKGDWRGISRNFVKTRAPSPSQAASRPKTMTQKD